MIADFHSLVRILSDEHVNFVIIGGVAMVAHGSSRTTTDFDFCYARDRSNLDALARALIPFRPRLRGVPEDLPFVFDAQTLRSGLNFTLTTTLGDIDLLGEVPGVGGFADLERGAKPVDLFGVQVLVIGLDDLERSKRAAGRAKDLIDLGEIPLLRSK